MRLRNELGTHSPRDGLRAYVQAARLRRRFRTLTPRDKAMKLIHSLYAAIHALMALAFAIASIVPVVIAARVGWAAIVQGLDLPAAEAIIEAVGLLAAGVVALQISQTVLEEEVVRDAHIGAPTRVRRFLSRFMVVIVVVVPAQDDPLLRRIDAALKQTATREAFIDREMVLYTVAAGVGRRNAVPLRPAQTRALLDALKLDAAGPPTFLLIGKDGGVKMTEGPAVDLAAVFAEIDRMPMRQR